MNFSLPLCVANKRGSLSFSSSLGSTAGGLDSSDPAVSTTGSIPATEFLSGHRSILDKLYFSDEVVELVTEVRIFLCSLGCDPTSCACTPRCYILFCSRVFFVVVRFSSPSSGNRRVN